MVTLDTGQKDKLRAQIRRARRALSPSEQTTAASMLAAHLVRHPWLRRARHIALYLAADGEIDPMPMMLRLLRSGKHCYLPVLSKQIHDKLWFAPVTPNTRYTVNRFGIHEPVVHARQYRRALGLDLILMPLVAFDHAGNRLGMGGGFYDRSLGFLQHRTAWHRPRLIGLAHALQRTDHLDANPWDIPLDAVATEQDFMLCQTDRS